MRNLYHFTDSMRLQRILRSVELRPATAGARNFVHATSNQHGEKTAATTMSNPDEKFYCRRSYAKVRFTLDAADFEQWLTVVGRYAEWTPKMIKELQDRGHENGSSPYSWYARAEPLPLDKVVAVHAMQYPDNFGGRSICRWRKYRRSRLGRTSCVSASVPRFSSASASSIPMASQATCLTG